MVDTGFSTSAFLSWHAGSLFVAVALLGILVFLVLQQFVFRDANNRGFRWLHGDSFKASLFVGLLLIGVLPLAALSMLLSERSASNHLESLEQHIEETATSVAIAVDRHIDKHLTGVITAASAINAAGRFDAASQADVLMRIHRIYDEYLTMLCTVDNGDIITATSRLTGSLQIVDTPTGFNVSDREYFSQPMTSGFPFVSNAFRGRGLGSDPIVAISAALKGKNGHRRGIVQASLNLSRFESIDHERPQIDGAVMILVDEDNRVVFASEKAGYSYLDDVSGTPMMLNAASQPTGKSYTYTLQDSRAQQQMIAAFSATATNWRVFISAPVEPIVQQMLGDYGLGALLLLLTVAMSVLLAQGLVRRVSRVISGMNDALLQMQVEGPDKDFVAPDYVPSEFRGFFTLAEVRSKQLKNAYHRLQQSMDAGEKLRKELTQAITLKDVEIADRMEELEQANKRLSTQNKKDPLTRIANRREFDTFQKRIWALAARESQPVSVIMIDLDNFKLYNDTLGHQAGDQCLQEVAAVLEGCATRPLDLVARYGGEEFVALLGGATVADALVVAERMRGAVLGLNIEHPSAPNELVTISAGAASVVPTANADPQMLVKEADEALYHAKAAGKNCVVFRRDGDFVTYEPESYDLDTTNVIAILAGSRPTRRRR